MKKLMIEIVFVACALALAGCETMKGAGRDIQSGGESIQQAAS